MDWINLARNRDQIVDVVNTVFYIRGSVHRGSILIRSNEMQQYAGVYLLQITLHVSGVYRTHLQEYIKL